MGVSQKRNESPKKWLEYTDLTKGSKLYRRDYAKEKRVWASEGVKKPPPPLLVKFVMQNQVVSGDESSQMPLSSSYSLLRKNLYK